MASKGFVCGDCVTKILEAHLGLKVITEDAYHKHSHGVLYGFKLNPNRNLDVLLGRNRQFMVAKNVWTVVFAQKLVCPQGYNLCKVCGCVLSKDGFCEYCALERTSELKQRNKEAMVK